MAKPNNLSQSLDVAGSLIRVDNLTLIDELDGVGTPVGLSGNAATITVGLGVNLSGVSGMTPASSGNYIQITGAANSANNGVFLIVDVLSATSIVILNDSAVDEGPGFNWSERTFYSLQTDLNYVRTDRATIKGVPYFQDVPSYFRVTNQVVPVPANLLNIAGGTTDAKGLVTTRLFMGATVNDGYSFTTITDPGNFKHADAVDITGVPVLDGFDAGNYDGAYVSITDGYGVALRVLSGPDVNNIIFGFTYAGSSVSPDSVEVHFFSLPPGVSTASGIPYSWESGQTDVVQFSYGYRQSLKDMDDAALRHTMTNGLLGDAGLTLRVDNLQQVIGVVDGDISLSSYLTNTTNYFPFSGLSSYAVTDALNILNQEIGDRNYSGGVLTDGYTVTESIQQLYDSFIGSSIALSNTPPVNVTKAAASAGIGLTASRMDHKHDISTASAIGLTGASTNTEGVATTIARSDHTHSITLDTDDISNVSTISGTTLTNALDNLVPITRTLTAGAGLTGGGDLSTDRTFDVGANADGSIIVNTDDIQVGILATDAQHGVRGGGTQHAVATTSVAGFMSASDKTKLDGIATGATNTPLSNTVPVNVTKAAAFAGVASEASRQDHKHDISTAAAVALTVGIANAEGVATTLARSDHTHAIAAGTPVAVGTANSAGVATTFTRGDHTHQVTGIVDGAATALTFGTITDTQVLVRSGTTIVSTTLPTAGGAPVDVTKAAASAGVATTYSRSDHKHDISTAAATTLTATTTNTEGAATSLARSNHTHAITTAIAVTNDGATNAIGTAVGLARADHTHQITGGTYSGIALTYGAITDGQVLIRSGTTVVGSNFIAAQAVVAEFSAQGFSNPASPWLHVGGAARDFNFASTSARELLVLNSCTLSKIGIIQGTAGAANNVTYTVYKNGVASALTAVILGNVTTPTVFTGTSVSFVQGDRIALNADMPSGTTPQGIIVTVG